jgi:putative membrane-bound dehydrogenase-like protein
MKRIALAFCIAVPALPALAAEYKPDHAKPLGFPIYTNAPSGKQLSGVYKATETPPLAPEESRKKINVPPGFEVRLFASEPEVVNPVAMTWDERGRLWVLELYEYPKGAKKGEKGRDRIKILEDTDADGKADKVTVFADGFSLATGLALGNGGVYLGVAPDLLFLEDTNGDDKADKTTVLKTGFGMEDRHELLNGFAWGPDGWLYMTHGVFTHSKVRDPSSVAASRESAANSGKEKSAALSRDAATNEHDPDGFGVQMDAALARYHPRTKKFEVFADGTSNPWGVDWNERGDAFVSACVIHHLFHMAPGGQYNRQGGTWANPYGYVGDLPSKGLPAIVDWRHFRAAHAGICIYQGDQWPAEWRGLVFIGNIHESAINCDRLTPIGSTYKAERETQLLGPRKGDYQVGGGTFLASDDRWFRPVSTQTGPDGAMWIADWCDKYPCYQNAQADPEGVDRELGRIWRVVWVGEEKGKAVASRPQRDMNFAKLNTDELAGLLEHPNNWQRRTAQRLIAERRDPKLLHTLHPGSKIHDLMNSHKPTDYRLAALWTLHSAGALDDNPLDELKKDKDPAIRAWVARLTGERGYPFGDAMKRLSRLALDTNASVRLAVAAAARQFISGSLTVDTPPAIPIQEVVTGAVLSDLHKSPFDPNDPVLPFVYWMALEPIVAFDAGHALDYYKNAKDKSESEWPMNPYILTKIMRRVCDLSDPPTREKHLNKAMEVLGGLASEPRLADAALDGLITSFKSKAAPPTIPLEPIFARLTSNPTIADKARRLATLLGDTSASRVLIAKINDARASLEDRLKGITAARETKDDVARAELIRVFTNPLTPALSPDGGEGVRNSLPPALSPDRGEGVKAGARPATLSPTGGEGRVRGLSEDQQRLYTESLRALGAFGGDDIAYAVTDAWKNFSLPTRRVASEVLVLRSKWSRALLAAVDQKTAKPEDISATARRALARSEDATVRDNADRLLGKYRAPGEDKLKLIAEKRKVVLAGEPDLKNGHEVAKRTCFVCHKLHGEGADVGPDLTGVGRSTLDALLHNVIDPNEVVGNGNEATEVELKDGTSLTGRIVEDSPSRLKLLASGPIEHVLAKSDIAVENGKPKIRTSQLSLMPEGLEVLPEKDFRDMIWFLLNPPEDQRPWTKELRKELIGE